MPELSRSQVLVYGAVCVALMLLGARWIRSADEAPGSGGGVAVVPAGDEDEVQVERADGDLVIHVAGAVREPGVYRLPDGSRVADAIERAGGPGGDALPDGLNLAAPLADGQQVILPSRTPGPAGGPAVAAGAGPISLGIATVEDLDTIEGIGPVTAADIVEYRDEHGGIASVDELDAISGIGPATMEALREELQP